MARTVTATAKVTSVDRARRVLVLRTERGESQRLLAGPEVRNFDQIAVGDTVRADYRVSLAVALEPAGDAAPDVTIDAAAGRAAAGATPGAGVGAQVSVVVRIESVDLGKHVVVFTAPGGELHVAEVQRPEGREFLRGLKAGDRVRITYTEALAVRLEKQ
ncbi:MAG: hypothetical protein KF830_04800 [Planctomycetes bacterium]|nr:hypothetical protein [Planctomycetota bacterium]